MIYDETLENRQNGAVGFADALSNLPHEFQNSYDCDYDPASEGHFSIPVGNPLNGSGMRIVILAEA